MLRGLDPLLTADLLHALCAMGHGDTVTIVDANFPATACARRLISAQGSDASAILRAILSVLPIDDFIPHPLLTMQVVGEPQSIPPAVAELLRIANEAGVADHQIASTDRHDFYRIARDSFAIVATGDRRLYANIAITKGVIRFE
jgi:L-fucose mutarotase